MCEEKAAEQQKKILFFIIIVHIVWRMANVTVCSSSSILSNFYCCSFSFAVFLSIAFVKLLALKFTFRHWLVGWLVGLALEILICTMYVVHVSFGAARFRFCFVSKWQKFTSWRRLDHIGLFISYTANNRHRFCCYCYY